MDPFAALADPVRRGLLRALAAGPARVVDLARVALPRIEAPTLAVLSRQDHRVAPADGAAAVARVGALAARRPPTELAWLDGCGHVIAVDRERARVFALTEAWLTRWVPVPGRAGATAHSSADPPRAARRRAATPT